MSFIKALFIHGSSVIIILAPVEIPGPMPTPGKGKFGVSKHAFICVICRDTAGILK